MYTRGRITDFRKVLTIVFKQNMPILPEKANLNQ